MKATICLSILITLLPLTALHAADEPTITRQQADAILSELKAIRETLARLAPQPAAPAAAQPAEALAPAAMKLDQEQVLGAANAPLTIVEFADYQCPFCQRFHTTTFEELRKKYVDTGKVRFVSVDFPLEFHQNAPQAAEGAHCAGDQGGFWKMREVLQLNAAKLSPADLPGYARSLYLDVPAFQACLASGKYKKVVEEERKKAASLAVSGTPTFLIGRTTREGVDGALLVGAQPLEAFEAAMQKLQTR